MFLYTRVPDNWLSFSYKTGVRVFVSNNTVETTVFDGMEVSTGFQTNLQVNREFIYKLPKPYNQCYNNLDKEEAFDSELYREFIRTNKTYRQIDCFRLCLQKAVVSNCHCNNVYSPSLYGIGPCSTLQQLTCAGRQYEKFYSVDIGSRCGHLW